MTDVRPGGADLLLKGVGHTYRSARSESVVALSPTDLEIEAGSFVALVGPSGCGKSTLLEIVAGLRPSTEGDVFLGGAKVVGPGRRRGVVFQQSSSLLPWRSVAGNVELGLLTAGVPKAERQERVAAELKRVGLTDFADGNETTLVRAVEGEQKQYRVRLDDLLEDGDITANVAVLPGDVIIVPESWF